MLHRLLTCLLITALVATPLRAAPAMALPDLGGSEIRMIAGTTEEEIGRNIVNQMRRANYILEDPELNEYLQHLGSRLVAASKHDGTQFEFFIVRDDSINAFALPGGYIGINSGLFLRTGSESELAGVIAHEVAHVTQRHISRRFDAGASNAWKALGVFLGAIALAASGASHDGVSGAVMLGQGMLVQEQINFTRAHEYEADRVGVEILANSGLDVNGMVHFFEKMQRLQRLQNSRMPEFLSTHPLSLSRVSETAQRVQVMQPREVNESRTYPLMHARLAVLTAKNPLASNIETLDNDAARYAQALAELEAGDIDKSVALFRELLQQDDSVTHFHIGLGNALLQKGDNKAALDAFDQATRLFPDNVPVALAHARALRVTGAPERALTRLRELTARQSVDPETLRLMAQIAADAGSTATSHFYMGEYYLRTGNLGAAREQLQLAVDGSDPKSREALQYEARLHFVQDELLAERRANPRRAGDRDRR